jgi:hypothetical protein
LSRNERGSRIDDFDGASLYMVQIIRRSMTGYKVLPAKARKLITNMGHSASRKEIIESGVSVKPKLSIMVCAE